MGPAPYASRWHHWEPTPKPSRTPRSSARTLALGKLALGNQRRKSSARKSPRASGARRGVSKQADEADREAEPETGQEEEPPEEQVEAPAPRVLRSKKKAPRKRASRPKSVGRKRRPKTKPAAASARNRASESSVDFAALAAGVSQVLSAFQAAVSNVATTITKEFSQWRQSARISESSRRLGSKRRGEIFGALLALILLFLLFRGRNKGNQRVIPDPPPAAASSAEGFAYWKESLRAYEQRIVTLENKYAAALDQIGSVENDVRKQASTCATSVAAGAAGAVDKATSASRDELQKKLAQTATTLRQELDTKLSKADKAASAAREAAVKKQSGEFEKHVKKAIEGATLAAKKHSEKAVASSAASLREDLKTIQKKSSSDIKEALTKSETAQARARDEQINAALEKIRGEMKSESARSDQKIKEIGENLGAISSAGNAGSIDAKALLKREKALVTEMRADLDKEIEQLKTEISTMGKDLTSLVSKEIKDASERQGATISQLQDSLASLREENSVFFGKGSFGGHKSAKKPEAAKKIASAQITPE